MILFLDIDGVIVSDRTHYSTGEHGLMVEPDPVALKAIRRFCAKTGARIVLSSAWRKTNGVLEHMSEWGLHHLLYDPPGGNRNDWRTITAPCDDSLLHERGIEIKEWLDRHPEETRYVILDDQPHQILPAQEKHLILCDPHEGMTSKNIYQLMQLAGYYHH